MKIPLFNGGLNIRQDSLLIAPNEAVEIENVDTSAGVLKSAKGMTETALTATNKPFFFESNDTWEDRIGPLTYLEYQRKLYWTETGRAQKYDGENQANLGITKPDTKLRIADFEPVAVKPTGISFSGLVHDYGNYDLSIVVSGGGVLKTGSYFLYIAIIEEQDGGKVVVDYHTQNFGPSQAQLTGYRLQVSYDGTTPHPGNIRVVILHNSGPLEDDHDLAGIIANTVFDLDEPILGVEAPFTIGSYTYGYWYDMTNYKLIHPKVLTPGDYTIGVAAESADGSHMSVMESDTFSLTSSHYGIEVTGTHADPAIDMHFYLRSAESQYYLFADDGLAPYVEPLLIDNTLEYVNIIDITVETNGDVIVTLDRDLESGDIPAGYLHIEGVSGMIELNGNNYQYGYTGAQDEILLRSTAIPTVNIDGTDFNPYSSGGRVYSNIYVTTGLDGTYQYIYTYYNAKDGTESQASPLSNEAVVGEGTTVILTEIIPSTDPQVTSTNLYRIGGTLLNFLQLAQLESDATTYTDFTADESVDGDIYNSSLNGAPPEGLDFLKQVYGIFVGAVGEKLYFTRDIGNPNYWPETYYINFPIDITGIGITGTNIIVFTKYKTYALTGSDARTFVKHNLSGDQGCLNHQTIAEFGGNLLFVSTDGICMLSGGNIKILTKIKLGKIVLDTVNAVIHDEVYYVQLTNNKILALDFRYEPSIKYYDFDTTFLVVAEDTLYGRKDGNLHTLFTGSEVAYTYKTGRYSEGVVTNLKDYNNIYIHSEGDHRVVVSINGVSVASHDITGTASLPTTDLTVPQNKMQGYDIQFKLTGTGTINELEYRAEGRKNGR